MADLVSAGMITDRLGPNVTVDTFQLDAFLADVSAQVRKATGGLLDTVDVTNIETDRPEVIPVVYAIVRRRLVNPDGFGSEMLDGHGWQQAPTEGVMLTRQERRAVRSAAGAEQTVTLVTPWSGD